jgi:monoamine oxidase
MGVGQLLYGSQFLGQAGVLVMERVTRRGAIWATGGAATALGFRPSDARANEQADVIVLGAGLSGLNAALLLEEQGQRVIVVEGRSRPGGRLYTFDDVPGKPDGGGSGIGRGYARLVDTAQKLNVPLDPQRARTEMVRDDALIAIKGQLIRPDAWAGHALNPYVGADRATMPWLMAFSALRNPNPLPEAAAWRDPAFASSDISVAAYLGAKGWTPDQLQLAYGTNPSYGNSAYDLTALMWFHIFKNAELMAGAGGGAMAARGGNQRIPEAMAKAVKGNIFYGKTAVRIHSGPDGASVTTSDGSVYRGKALICAIPFSAARLVRFDPAPPMLVQDAIDTLAYNRVHQIHFVPTRKFWEADGLPPSMWSDGLAGRFVGLRYGAAGSTQGSKPEITTFLSFANGFAADRRDRLGPAAASAAVLDELARIRPSTRGALELVKVHSWGADPFAGGAYACWQPGQITRYANELSKPFGRVFFAGEHTAAVARGMEGAMESGERAALETLDLIG